ncbi:MAG: hypothetical protein Kow0098_26190 [Ignavibacteriaceae bacterium]
MKFSASLYKYLSNVYLIAFIITVFIIISLPDIFSEFEIRVSEMKVDPKSRNYYVDLNEDGNSESILYRYLGENFFSFTVHEHGRIIDQWNFTGVLLSKPISENLFGDINKEIIFFSFENNKIYMHCFNPFNNKFYVKDKYVIDFFPKRNFPDCQVIELQFIDLNRDGIKEFYFFSGTGYSIQPRRLYKYDPASDSIITSVKSYAGIELDNIITEYDDKFRIVIASDAVGNGKPDDPYTDHFAWLMQFDENLELKSEPVIIGSYPSNSSVIKQKIADQEYFVYFNIYSGINKDLSFIRLADRNLKTLKEIKFPYSDEWYKLSLYADESESDHFYIIKGTGIVEKYDSNLDIVKKISIPPIGIVNYSEADLNNDGKNELIFQSRDPFEIIICKNDFSEYKLVNLGGQGIIDYSTVKTSSSGRPALVIPSDVNEYLLQYHDNFLYYLRFPVYAGIYIVVFLIIKLFEKALRYRAELKFKSERKIAELQLLAIKNQLDPHFTLNIINSIGSLFYKQDRDKADYIFGKYSKLLRSTILNSDKIVTSLAQELKFVENYLELEKFRNENSFCWKTSIADNVDKNIRIPKMLIHTFAENAIKHGLRHRKSGGELIISVKRNNTDYRISIRDNGVGRKKASEYESYTAGTKKGLKIIDQILDLYHNMMKVRISYIVKDLTDEGNNATGTEVIIIIPTDFH